MDHPHDSKPIKFTGFELLLIDIRTKLGSSWSLFEECLEAIFRMARRGQDTSAWLEQMDQLLQSREDLAISHQGIQFLLAEKGIKKQPRPARSTIMAPPPLPERLMAPPPTPKVPHLLTPNMHPPVKYVQKRPHSQSSLNYLQQHPPAQTLLSYSPRRTPGQDYSYFLPLRTPTQSSFNHTPQRTPTESCFELFSEHTLALPASDPNPPRAHSSYNRLPQRLPTGPVPSDPAIPISVGCPPLYGKPQQLPELPVRYYGKVAYFPDPNKPTALREEVSSRTVFFADPTFAHNVEDFFGCNDYGGGAGAGTGSGLHVTSVDELRAPYDAETDDLAVWQASIEGEGEVTSGGGQELHGH